MVNQKKQATELQYPTVDYFNIIKAEDGAEVLFGIAQNLEQKRGEYDDYAQQIRKTAHAIRDITDDLKPWVVANTSDQGIGRKTHIIPERDSSMGANEHRSELAFRLGIKS